MKRFLIVLSLFLIASCASSPDDRLHNMHQLIKGSDFEERIFLSSKVLGMHKGQGDIAKIFIEGDGLSWKTRRIISDDPTPKNPVGLKLALKERGDLVIYLGRPCQYVMQYGYKDKCSYLDWSYDRYSSEILEDMNQVIEEYKKLLKFKKVDLYGFSGGGTMAMLLAANRNDVLSVTTYSGNLDTEAWVEHHNISPLRNSLNPKDYKSNLINMPQVHYVGSRDKVVPPELAREFIKDLPNARVIEMDKSHMEWGD